jgi:hypothetical protein
VPGDATVHVRVRDPLALLARDPVQNTSSGLASCWKYVTVRRSCPTDGRHWGLLVTPTATFIDGLAAWATLATALGTGLLAVATFSLAKKTRAR